MLDAYDVQVASGYTIGELERVLDALEVFSRVAFPTTEIFDCNDAKLVEDEGIFDAPEELQIVRDRLNYACLLYTSKEEFEAFSKRHASHRAPRTNMGAYEGEAFLGIDSGSEAIKYALIAKDGSILRTYYARSAGNLIEAARDMLLLSLIHISPTTRTTRRRGKPSPTRWRRSRRGRRLNTIATRRAC